MKTRTTFPSLLTAALLLATAVHLGGAEGWLTDWEAAKAQAAAEKKVLLINFSGSDWCGWCVRLEKEVFSQEAFLAEAGKRYVMVLLDFPRDRSGQSDELQKQNQTLQDTFGVGGFPTIFLAEADGTPFAQTGYQRGGPEAYLAHLDELIANHRQVRELEAKLPGTTGVERARMLDEICSKMSVDSLRKTEYMTEIVKLDADNEAGLKGKYMVAAAMASRASSIRAGKFEDAIAACDKVLAWDGLPADQRQLLLIAKSEVFLNSGDPKQAKALLLQAKQAMPESPVVEQIDKFLAGPWFEGVE